MKQRDIDLNKTLKLFPEEAKVPKDFVSEICSNQMRLFFISGRFLLVLLDLVHLDKSDVNIKQTNKNLK